MLAATLLMGLLAACGGNSASIVGSWVEPVPGLEGQVQGIKMEEGGVASSVNMATLVYESWKQEGTKLILGFGHLSYLTVEALDGVSCVNQSSDMLIISKIGR